MPDRKTELRKAAVKRHRNRKKIDTPRRECEDCGTAINPNNQGYDAVLCWDCLQLLNGNQRAGRPRLTVERGGSDAA